MTDRELALDRRLTRPIAGLAAGAAAWADRDAAARAKLAERTARSTAAAADGWIEAALTIKRSSDDASRAEETATGPLATLRLLLVTARSLADVGCGGLPRLVQPPRLSHGGRDMAAKVEIDVLPAFGPRGSLHDRTTSSGLTATVRCVNPGGLEAFERSWREEAGRRPRSGGVALVLGAGNVTGLAPADCISQIFEHGRTALLKLHPLHAPLAPALNEAFAPLVEAGLLSIECGGPEIAAAALASPSITHVHLTGGEASFDAVVWGGRDRRGSPVLDRSISCELGSVSPWIIVPGRYTDRELAVQADMVAASVVNNTSFNCIATKLVVTARAWPQRDAFLALVQRRLERVRPRTAWYPGSREAWEMLAGGPAPADGTLPWILRTGLDPDRDPRLVEREWFVPVAAEIPLAADSVESFCVAVNGLIARLPGSLAATVTLPRTLAPHDAARAELLVEHLPFGVVAVNVWSAVAYALANVPWGGFPGGTLASPKSGIGRVHDPLLLPLVHNAILRGPLAPWPMPAWFPWHPHAASLARGLLSVYAEIARGHTGLWRLAGMVPAVLSGVDRGLP